MLSPMSRYCERNTISAGYYAIDRSKEEKSTIIYRFHNCRKNTIILTLCLENLDNANYKCIYVKHKIKLRIINPNVKLFTF